MNDVDFYLSQFDLYFNTDRMIYTYPYNMEEWVIEVPQLFLRNMITSNYYHQIVDGIANYLVREAEKVFESYNVTNLTNVRTLGTAIKVVGKRKN